MRKSNLKEYNKELKKTKSFTLLSGCENSISWNISMTVRADGMFEGKGHIRLIENNKYRKKRKNKNITLLSGSFHSNCWRIMCKIQDNGTFNCRSVIHLTTSKEKKKMQKRSYLKHRPERLITNRNYYQNNKEVCNKRSKEEYEKHKEKYIELTKEYTRTHPELRKQINQKYYTTHKEQILEYNKLYRKDHKEFIRERDKNYRNTEACKISQRRMKSKRRKMGFEIIAKINKNKIASPTIYHHINNNEVIEVPKWMHVKCNSPSPELHRKRLYDYLKSFLNETYYDILNQEGFDKYGTGNY